MFPQSDAYIFSILAVVLYNAKHEWTAGLWGQHLILNWPNCTIISPTFVWIEVLTPNLLTFWLVHPVCLKPIPEQRQISTEPGDLYVEVRNVKCIGYPCVSFRQWTCAMHHNQLNITHFLLAITPFFQVSYEWVSDHQVQYSSYLRNHSRLNLFQRISYWITNVNSPRNEETQLQRYYPSSSSVDHV